jgi:hypothetical protein
MTGLSPAAGFCHGWPVMAKPPEPLYPPPDQIPPVGSRYPPPGQIPPPHCKGLWYRRWWVIALVLFVLIVVIAGISDPPKDEPTGRPVTPPTTAASKTSPQPSHSTSAAPSTSSAPPATTHRTRSTSPPRRRRRVHVHPPRHRVHVTGAPAKDFPNPALTPGAVLPVAAAAVCVSGYSASVRDVPDSESEQAYARYHVVHRPYMHEVDHLISLELGGSNDITNLWPEPYAGRWGARTKDALENKLHDLVCSGSLSLVSAQRQEATNWVKAYRKYMGTLPAPTPAPTPAPPSMSSTPPARTASGANCEPGYSPCLPVAGDLNCDDISDSLKPITVTGDDPYGLDADGDGSACES